MNRDINDLIDDWLTGCYKATASNIASITPPSNPARKADRAYEIVGGRVKPSQTKAQQTKNAIESYKKQLDKSIKAGSLYLLSDAQNKYKINQSSLVGLYIYDKGKGVRKPRKTNLPLFTNAKRALDWYYANSRVYKSKRVINKGVKALVSSERVVDKMRDIVKRKVGSFVAGWNSFFNVLGMKINRYTTATALKNAGHKGDAERGENMFYAENTANTNSSLRRYVQAFLTEDRIQKDLDYYKRNRMKFLIKSLNKHFGKTEKEAKSIIMNFEL